MLKNSMQLIFSPECGEAAVVNEKTAASAMLVGLVSARDMINDNIH